MLDGILSEPKNIGTRGTHRPTFRSDAVPAACIAVTLQRFLRIRKPVRCVLGTQNGAAMSRLGQSRQTRGQATRRRPSRARSVDQFARRSCPLAGGCHHAVVAVSRHPAPFAPSGCQRLRRRPAERSNSIRHVAPALRSISTSSSTDHTKTVNTSMCMCILEHSLKHRSFNIKMALIMAWVCYTR